MPDRTGQQLGNYKLTRQIGHGGFADIYRGEHIHLSNQVAIKVLHTQLTVGDQQRFLDEARTMAKLQHPNIVRVLDCGIEKGTTPYLIMEYAVNGTLRQRLPASMCLSIDVILPYIKQVADALQYIHNNKLIHRDVKPENMLLGQNYEMLLSDFGLAVATQQQGPLYGFGTASYIAPEQIQGNPCAASDQYALGVVVFEWLCGIRPFTGASVQEILDKHLKMPPPSLRSIVPSISPAIEDVVLRSLAKNPQQRYPAVQDFARAFETACEIVPPTNSAPTAPLGPTAVSSPVIPASTGGSSPTVPMSISNLSTTKTVPLTSSSLQNTVLAPPPPVERKPGDVLYIHEGHTHFVPTVAWSPDGSHIASGCHDYEIHVWDASTGGNSFIYQGHDDRIWALAWSPNGKHIVSASVDQLVQIWDIDTRKARLSYQHGRAIWPGQACAVAWSKDGQYIASGGADHMAYVWRADAGDKICTFKGHSDDVNAIAWSPDGMYLATASDDKTVRIWNVAARDSNSILIYSKHTKQVRAVAWSPNDQRIASAGDDRTVHVWNASSGDQGPVLVYRGHARRVCAIAWSTDGSLIASAGNDWTVQIWSATTGERIFTYRGHSEEVRALAWSPDGMYLASASDDRTVHVWQAR